jgi:hypothetical protein
MAAILIVVHITLISHNDNETRQEKINYKAILTALIVSR